MFTIKIYPNNFHVFDKDGILVFDSDYDYDEDYKDIQKVLDNMIAHYMEVIDSLGLSRVSDSGSLKRDEAWDGAEILKQEIMRLRKIESRVDKTKDGVCVFIGDEVFMVWGDMKIIIYCQIPILYHQKILIYLPKMCMGMM